MSLRWAITIILQLQFPVPEIESWLAVLQCLLTFLTHPVQWNRRTSYVAPVNGWLCTPGAFFHLIAFRFIILLWSVSLFSCQQLEWPRRQACVMSYITSYLLSRSSVGVIWQRGKKLDCADLRITDSKTTVGVLYRPWNQDHCTCTREIGIWDPRMGLRTLIALGIHVCLLLRIYWLGANKAARMGWKKIDELRLGIDITNHLSL